MDYVNRLGGGRAENSCAQQNGPPTNLTTRSRLMTVPSSRSAYRGVSRDGRKLNPAMLI